MKYSYKLVIVLFLALSTLGLKMSGQTVDLGEPVTWQSKEPSKLKAINLPQIDVNELKAEDEINMSNKVGPFRFGHEHIVNFDLLESGSKLMTEDGGEVFRIAFKAKNALTMNVFFNVFRLGEGEKLYVYDKHGKYYDGAYTSLNNQADGMLSTMPIPTDEIVIEYYRPAMSGSNSELVIGHVVQGYRDVARYFSGYINQAKGLNDSGPCNYDTGCSELPGNPFGNPGEWNDQIASVGLMLLNGSRICSGAMVNNTANDGTPYFLSANHCGTTNGGGRSFLFGYESPDPVCATNASSSNGPTTAQINGAVLRASNFGSDVALWELNSTPPASFNVYYAGWDRSGTPPTEVTGIHHPSGDVKKICREEDSPFFDTAGGAAVWWINEWEWGVTEPGSSGSPIFDQNKRIVGQLYGGLAACSGTVNNGTYDYYGRFDVSWDNGSSSSSRLSDWLDPLGTNPTAIDGYDPNATPLVDLDASLVSLEGVEGFVCNQSNFSPEITIKNEGLNNLTSIDIDYSLDGQPLGSIQWTGDLSTDQSEIVSLPVLNIDNSGVYDYSVTLSNPNGESDENTLNNTASSQVEVVVGAESTQLDLTFDCWANETSWEIISDATGNVIASGDGYSGSLDGQTVTEVLCLAEGCYTFNIFDSFGDGLNGAAYSSCGINGDYTITEGSGNVLVEMTAPNADFGNSATHQFCVGTGSPPCQAPYPQVANLSTTVQSNGVLFEWDPIPGSIGCQVQAGFQSGGSTNINLFEPEVSDYFVSQTSLQSGQAYQWRVRCACSTNPLIIGPWSTYEFFTFGAAAKTNTENEFAWQLYPNPVEEELNISIDNARAGSYVFRIFDLQGRNIMSQNTFVEEYFNTRIDVNGVEDGMYILEMSNGVSSYTKPFVKR